MKPRFIEEKIAKVLMILSTLLVFMFVTSIIYTILKRGLPALNWDMISKIPEGGFRRDTNRILHDHAGIPICG